MDILRMTPVRCGGSPLLINSNRDAATVIAQARHPIKVFHVRLHRFGHSQFGQEVLLINTDNVELILRSQYGSRY